MCLFVHTLCMFSVSIISFHFIFLCFKSDCNVCTFVHNFHFYVHIHWNRLIKHSNQSRKCNTHTFNVFVIFLCELRFFFVKRIKKITFCICLFVEWIDFLYTNPCTHPTHVFKKVFFVSHRNQTYFCISTFF